MEGQLLGHGGREVILWPRGLIEAVIPRGALSVFMPLSQDLQSVTGKFIDKKEEGQLVIRVF